jgi:predicted ArsR family transcriptional regulator
MSDDKTLKEPGYDETADAEKSIKADDLNSRLGVLTRREVEARILKPVIDDLGEAFGRDAVQAVVRDTIVKIAREQGAALSQQMGGNSLKHFVDSLAYWTKDGALEIDLIEDSEEVFSFNVTRCRYAELYESLGIRAMGTIFSCSRDFALIEGFNADISLKRTQTIMEGADYCDFRYRHKKQLKDQC